jgi:hypothetical protein
MQQMNENKIKLNVNNETNLQRILNFNSKKQANRNKILS